MKQDFSRRRFVCGLAGGCVLVSTGILRRQVFAGEAGTPVLEGPEIDLHIGYREVNFTGKQKTATVINGSLPAPVLRWQEGKPATIRVTNHLAEDSSVHWHGMILPSNMDGVPNLSFPGIRPGETFTYRFDVRQNGTYWYHSHSGFQEQTGVYGAIVIDPAAPDPVAFDREHVVVLSDWSDAKPERVFARLKKRSEFYNFNQRTFSDLWRDLDENGLRATWNDRLMWNMMRMSDRDIADVTGYTYTYLMNGQTPASGWKALFRCRRKGSAQIC